MAGVPVRIAAKIYGKDPAWIRAGIISGWLPIGNATRNGRLVTSLDQMDSRLGRINYYISPKKLYEETGYEYEHEGKSKTVEQEPILDLKGEVSGTQALLSSV